MVVWNADFKILYTIAPEVHFLHNLCRNKEIRDEKILLGYLSNSDFHLMPGDLFPTALSTLAVDDL